jgi:hypothetical protein
MTYYVSHPAYPSRQELREEAHANAMAARDLKRADRLRLILRRTAVLVGRLEFETTWPAWGYDKESTLELLADMQPAPECERDIDRIAYERVRCR